LQPGIGIIDITVAGGTGVYDFLWTNSDITEDADLLTQIHIQSQLLMLTDVH